MAEQEWKDIATGRVRKLSDATFAIDGETFIDMVQGQFTEPVEFGAFTVRGDGSGNFDEVFGPGIHVEMMSDGQVWMRFEAQDGSALALFFTAEKRGSLHVKVEGEITLPPAPNGE